MKKKTVRNRRRITSIQPNSRCLFRPRSNPFFSNWIWIAKGMSRSFHRDRPLSDYRLLFGLRWKTLIEVGRQISCEQSYSANSNGSAAHGQSNQYLTCDVPNLERRGHLFPDPRPLQSCCCCITALRWDSDCVPVRLRQRNFASYWAAVSRSPLDRTGELQVGPLVWGP